MEDGALRKGPGLIEAIGRFLRGMQLAEEQLQLSRTLGDEESELSAVQGIVVAALALDDAQRAWSHVELMEALAARQAEGPDTVRHMKAEALRALGRLNEAEALYRQNLDQAAMTGDSVAIMHAAINLALLSLARPDVDTARKWIERVIKLRAQGERWYFGCACIHVRLRGGRRTQDQIAGILEIGTKPRIINVRINRTGKR